jgi:hypothetical protein
LRLEVIPERLLMRSLVLVILAMLATAAPAQRPPLAQPFAPATLGQMTRKAGMIFAGTVLRVERISADVPEIRTTFYVSRAVCGTRARQNVIVREFLPTMELPPYRRGQKVFLFLYPDSGTGLTSPVGGTVGRFAVDQHGNVLLRSDQPHLGAGRAATQGGAPRRVPYSRFIRALRAEAR